MRRTFFCETAFTEPVFAFIENAIRNGESVLVSACFRVFFICTQHNNYTGTVSFITLPFSAPSSAHLSIVFSSTIVIQLAVLNRLGDVLFTNVIRFSYYTCTVLV